MRVAAAVIGCLVIGVAWSGCSSTDNQPKGAAGAGGSGGQAGGPSDDGGARDPNLNCVKPGTPNNEQNVGGYCESTSDCPSDAGTVICSNVLDTTPRYAWFCTKLCSTDTECGTGAYCGHSDLGNGCVPNPCGAPPDGGVPDATAEAGDAAADAAPDQAPDVAPEASPDVMLEASPDVAPEAASDTSADTSIDVTTTDGATD
jgi:hypothetical protein